MVGAFLMSKFRKGGAYDGKFSSAGEKLLPASAAVTTLGIAAVKTASDFDSSMSQVATVSGAVEEDFDKLRAKARAIGAKTKFSASEAADAMNYMSMSGWKTSDILCYNCCLLFS